MRWAVKGKSGVKHVCVYAVIKKKKPDNIFDATFSIHSPKDHMISFAYTQYVHQHHLNRSIFNNEKWTEVKSPKKCTWNVYEKKNNFRFFNYNDCDANMMSFFYPVCALPVELQRGRRPISIKNHDMAQETPRFSEDGPWTRDQFARQGTLISFFPRLWTRDTFTHIYYNYLYLNYEKYITFFVSAICTWCTLRDVDFFFFKFSFSICLSDVIF